MSAGSDHDVVSELLGAYALDAVDADEALVVEDHLRECPRCRDEMRQHREVAAQLAFVGEAAPEGVWASIAANLTPSEPEPELAARLYPLRRPRPADRWMSRAWLPAAAAAIVLLVGGLGWEVHNQGNRVQRITAAFRATTSMDQSVQAALVDPRSTKFALASADGKIRLDAVLQPDGTGYLLPVPRATLPALPSSETYELWGVTDGQRTALGLLGPDPTVESFRTSQPQMGELAITAEKAGGVAHSTRTPVVAGMVGSAADV